MQSLSRAVKKGNAVVVFDEVTKRWRAFRKKGMRKADYNYWKKRA
ncbi:MAG TPA: hypothetical protein PKW49_04170 [Paludibacteraceae bacterium]|nr:hypothetical protein [Paludibacteraceae bacterium]